MQGSPLGRTRHCPSRVEAVVADMKKLVLCLLVCWTACQLSADESAWVTSVPEAKAQAKKENKLVLINFTGLDWCVPCKEMEKETYTKPEFLDYAKKNLVLVQLDFLPIKKQSDDLVKANTELQHEFNVEVFPTTFLINPDGKILWNKRGYLKGGPTAMIGELEGAKAATKSVSTPTNNSVPPSASH